MTSVDTPIRPSSQERIEGLSNGELVGRLDVLSRDERASTLAVIDHLVEVSRRRLHVELSYKSMWEYCRDRLGYSESATHRRLAAARCIRRFPRVRELLQDRRMSLSVLSLIERRLTPANVGALLESACGKGRREVEAMLSHLERVRVVYSQIQPVVVMKPRPQQPPLLPTATSPATEPTATSPATEPTATSSTAEPAATSPTVTPPSAAEPTAPTTGSEAAGAHGGTSPSGPDTAVAYDDLTEQRYRFQFAASESFLRAYQEVASLLSNRLRGRLTIEAVFETVMNEYIERHSPKARENRRSQRQRKRGNSTAHEDEPRGRGAEDKTRGVARHVPAALRDRIFLRDANRCTFVSTDGRRCTATDRLHIDHVLPVSLGGTSEPSNLRLLCAHHNQLWAERTLGANKMARYFRRE